MALPKTLYHYTNEAGLYGILESQSLWCTHYKFLNDSAEIRHIFDLADQVGNNKLKQEIIEILLEIFGLNGKAPWFDTYIVSFCKKYDLLSQWRAYGKNGGYAIGLDSKKLNDICSQDYMRHRFQMFEPYNVIYENKRKLRILKESINEFIKLKSDIKKLDPKKVVESKIIRFAPFFKHEGFQSEGEYRIVSWCDNKNKKIWDSKLNEKEKMVYFREESGIRIPYIKLFEDEDIKLPIKEIIIGPPQGVIAEQKKRVLELFLHQKNIDAVVKISKIPFVEKLK